jgi:hypothetical protein
MFLNCLVIIIAIIVPKTFRHNAEFVFLSKTLLSQLIICKILFELILSVFMTISNL